MKYFLMGEFNAQTLSNQAIFFSNYSNRNRVWLDPYLELANRYKIILDDLGENLFGSKLVKLCSAQDIIICNGLPRRLNYIQMAFIHGLGSSVADYVIYDIPLYNKLKYFEIFNDYEPNCDHTPLIIILNISTHSDLIEENYIFQST